MTTSLVKGLITDAVGKLTGTSFIKKLNGIKLSKSKAIQIIAISNGLNFGRKDSNMVKNSKNYLLERCAKSSSYTDSDTGLTVQYTESTRVSIKSDEITRLKELIKVEETKILEAELAITKGRKCTEAMAVKLDKIFAGSSVTRNPYQSWSMVK